MICPAILAFSFIAFAADPRAQFVDVGDGVKLEVLDWGGSGRPVMLLAGSGNTAHICEDFAPKLADAATHTRSRVVVMALRASRSGAIRSQSLPKMIGALANP